MLEKIQNNPIPVITVMGSGWGFVWKFARSSTAKRSGRSRNACMVCGACNRNCPTGAIYMESSVGCAAAVINAMLSRQNSACCCPDEKG